MSQPATFASFRFNDTPDSYLQGDKGRMHQLYDLVDDGVIAGIGVSGFG